MEARRGGPVQRAEQQPCGVRRVGRVGEVAVGRPVGGDGLGLDQSGVGLGVGGDRAQRGAGGERGGALPGAVGEQPADQGEARAEDGGERGRGQVAAVEPVGQDAVGEPAEGEEESRGPRARRSW
ncbi:hypothetical protein ACFQ3Z_27345 [Streptomyces nogalater]